jgi:hypothetical protein
MPYASLETSDVDMNVLRHKMLKRLGWYMPTLNSNMEQRQSKGQRY